MRDAKLWDSTVRAISVSGFLDEGLSITGQHDNFDERRSHTHNSLPVPFESRVVMQAKDLKQLQTPYR